MLPSLIGWNRDRDAQAAVPSPPPPPPPPSSPPPPKLCLQRHDCHRPTNKPHTHTTWRHLGDTACSQVAPAERAFIFWPRHSITSPRSSLLQPSSLPHTPTNQQPIPVNIRTLSQQYNHLSPISVMPPTIPPIRPITAAELKETNLGYKANDLKKRRILIDNQTDKDEEVVILWKKVKQDQPCAPPSGPSAPKGKLVIKRRKQVASSLPTISVCGKSH